MSFTPDQVALLEANRDTVEAVMCLELQFSDGTVRICSAPRTRVIAGETWQGAGYVDGAGNPGSWVEASPVRRTSVFAAEPVTYRVAATTASIASAILHDVDKYRGRKAIRYVQLFAAGVPVGPLTVLHTGRMQDARGREDVEYSYVELVVESRFSNRNQQPVGTYTDTDQKRRHPGDRGLELIHTFARRVLLKGWLTG